MKTTLLAVGVGIVIVAASLLLSFGLNWMSAIWLLWPGILFNHFAFRNYNAESHMVGWPSGLEILSILIASFLTYSVAAGIIIRLLRKRNSRSSA